MLMSFCYERLLGLRMIFQLGGVMGFEIGRCATHRLVLLGCTALASLFGGAAAFGQTVEEGDQTLAEVVVTAQKRQQNLQDVPISITAVTQEVLQANRITNV